MNNAPNASRTGLAGVPVVGQRAVNVAIVDCPD